MPVQFIESPRFPEDISYGSQFGPTFNTVVFTAQSGHEQRGQLWSRARIRGDVSHGIRDRVDMDVVLAFFYNVKGRAIGFRVKDWADYIIQNQKIGDGDAAEVNFQIIKEYTVGTNTYTREIRKPVNYNPPTPTKDIQITVGGTPVTEGVDYTVDYTTGIVTFTSPPALDADIVVVYCEFDVPMRFDSDDLPLTLEAFELETADSITLIEIRPQS